MRRNLILLALAVALALASNARAGEEPAPAAPAAPSTEGSAAELLARGKKLIEEGRAEEAYEVLHAAFVKEPGSIEVNYHLGRAAFAAGEYDKAVTAYDRILISNPELHRVRFELGRSYYGLGHYSGALEEFEKVLAALPAGKPELRRTVELQIARCRFRLAQYPEAKQNFERLLVELPAERARERAMAEEYLLACERFLRRHFVTGRLSVGMTYDSNATVAPAPSTVDTVIGRVTLDPDAREEEDGYFSTLLTLNHTVLMPPEGLAWRTGLTAYDTRYLDEEEQNITYLRLATGPTLARPLSGEYAASRTDLHLGLSPFFTYMQRDDEDYLQAWGLDVSGSLVFTQPERSLLVGAGVKLERREIDPDPDRDADNLEVLLHSRLRWGARAENELGLVLSWERELAEAADESYAAGGASLGYRRKLPWELEGSVGYSFRFSQYDHHAPLFEDAREDGQHRLSAGLSRKLPWWDLEANVFCQHTISDSNVDLYEYDRTLVGIGLTKEF